MTGQQGTRPAKLRNDHPISSSSRSTPVINGTTPRSVSSSGWRTIAMSNAVRKVRGARAPETRSAQARSQRNPSPRKRRPGTRARRQRRTPTETLTERLAFRRAPPAREADPASAVTPQTVQNRQERRTLAGRSPSRIRSTWASTLTADLVASVRGACWRRLAACRPPASDEGVLHRRSIDLARQRPRAGRPGTGYLHVGHRHHGSRAPHLHASCVRRPARKLEWPPPGILA